MLEPTPVQRRGMRNAVFNACFSSVAIVAFTNGLMLLLLTSLGCSSERVVIYLSLPSISGAVLAVPLALLADRHGKKLFGIVGIVMSIVGYAILTVIVLLGKSSEVLLAASLVLYTLGTTTTGSSWFAILSPVVPESMRGRFFARMRVSWQTLNIFFTAACALYLSQQTPLPVFGGLLALLTISQIIQLIFYLRIPELEPADPKPIALGPTMMHVFRTEGFMSFCAYMFLLTLATASVPILFGLIEKKQLNYGDDLVMWLGSLYMVGAVLGFAAGGRTVDRLGTRPVFLIAHIGYAIVLTLFLMRSFLPQGIGSTFAPVAAANFLYGFLWAFASIAATTEMLGLIPAENKSLSTSLHLTFIRIGAALSGMLTAGLLKLGIVSPQWQLWGANYSRYDAVLLFCATGIILLVVTLGLVPSVIHKAQWMPRQY